MAKGTGLIGNFKGKVGNTVGYKLSASNNGQTQGIRVYQPIVKNPKTAAQAEQRAKLSPINATYRALKMVIDRGNEGLPYGNKSRLAWLKKAFNANVMPWIEKGKTVGVPVCCELTKGSLAGLTINQNADGIEIVCTGVTSATPVATIGNVSTALMAAYPSLKKGDQITFVSTTYGDDALQAAVASIILDPASTEATTAFEAQTAALLFKTQYTEGGIAVIVSREGDNGEHLRSTSTLMIGSSQETDVYHDADAKAAAIESYQSSDASNSDWAEESIQ